MWIQRRPGRGGWGAMAVAVALLAIGAATSAAGATPAAEPSDADGPRAAAYDPPIQGTAWAGASLKAGHATFDVVEDWKVKYKVCDDKVDGWGVVAYGKLPRGSVFTSGKDASSRGGCESYTAKVPAKDRRLAIKVCKYKGSDKKACHHLVLVDRINAGRDKRAGRAVYDHLRLDFDDVVETCVRDRKADGWGVKAKLYDPKTGRKFVKVKDPSASADNGHCGHAEWPESSNRLAIKVCKYRNGDVRGCRARLLADHHRSL